MPIVHTSFDQGTSEWYAVRAGKVTASELGSIVTPEFKERVGDGRRTYLYSKVAEAWSGQCADGFSTWETEEGILVEEEARKWFVFESGQRVHNAAFVERDDRRFGCSPDALIGEDGGLELKCPQQKAHVKYLIEGILPKDYAAQVHGSMYATGRASWTFVSYRRKFPPFVLTVQRDEAIISKIGAALASFYAEFDAAMATLKAR